MRERCQNIIERWNTLKQECIKLTIELDQRPTTIIYIGFLLRKVGKLISKVGGGKKSKTGVNFKHPCPKSQRAVLSALGLFFEETLTEIRD